MELYETMLIIRPDLEAEEREEVLNGLSSTIEKNDGKVETVLDWHKRRLAYEINKHKEGYYYLIYFKGSGTIIPETEHYFRVNDAVIRYLTVCSTEQELQLAAEKAAKDAEKGAEPTEAGGLSTDAGDTDEPASVAVESEGSEEPVMAAATNEQQAEDTELAAPVNEAVNQKEAERELDEPSEADKEAEETKDEE